MNSAATPKIFPAVSASPKGKPDDLMRDELKHHEGGMSRYELVREAADLWLRLQAAPALPSEVNEWFPRSADPERVFSCPQAGWPPAGQLTPSPSLPPGRHPTKAKLWPFPPPTPAPAQLRPP